MIRDRIRCSERPWVAEELGQTVDDRIDVVAELADEVGAGVVFDVADEMGGECSVMKEFLEGRLGDGHGLQPRRGVAVVGCRRHRQTMYHNGIEVYQ
jgi:hypothetical protein